MQMGKIIAWIVFIIFFLAGLFLVIFGIQQFSAGNIGDFGVIMYSVGCIVSWIIASSATSYM